METMQQGQVNRWGKGLVSLGVAAHVFGFMVRPQEVGDTGIQTGSLTATITFVVLGLGAILAGVIVQVRSAGAR